MVEKKPAKAEAKNQEPKMSEPVIPQSKPAEPKPAASKTPDHKAPVDAAAAIARAAAEQVAAARAAAAESPGPAAGPSPGPTAGAHLGSPPPGSPVSGRSSAGPSSGKPQGGASSGGASAGNPFLGASGLSGLMKDFDFSKLFSEMKVPALPDMEAVVSTYKRNLEALAEANRVAMDGAQAVARRHLEIVQSTMSELTDGLKSLTVTDAPATRAAKHAELVKHAYESVVSNTRELSDLIQKSNAEAMQKLNYRFSEAMNELKTLFNKL